MKPILIVQHEHDVGPGRFEHYLIDNGFPHEFVRVFANDSMPSSAERYSGLCALGGSMSANDELPWIDSEIALMRSADQLGVPIIGHCLGGQLLAKTFGAPVTRSSLKEIGWGQVDVDNEELARHWVGAITGTYLFQWHGDTFAIPVGGRRFLTSRFCTNQAFVIERGGFAHLGMQFHVEMTAELVHEWATDPLGRAEIERAFAGQDGAGVQLPDEMLRNLDERAQRMAVIADRLYDNWTKCLRR